MSDDEATITELAKGIFLYENVFDAEDFVQMIEKEAAKDWPYLSWVPSSTGNGTVSEYRTSYQLELGILLGTDVIDGHRLHKVSQLWKKMFNAIDRYVYDYRDKHSLTLSSDEGYRVLKYSNGSEYLEHIDWHPDNDRQISLVGWLNDDFEGGELYFKHFDLTIKPKAGSFVIFPSNFLYLHSALPVGDVNKHDIKYSFVTWFR
jgi:hypothetical protein